MKIPEVVLKLCEYLEDKKAENLCIADTTKMANIANYNIIATATSVTHTKALADYLEEQVLKNKDCSLVAREGFNFSEWIVLDFNEIFVHIFTKEKREYYNIEKLFNEGNNIKTFDKVKKDLEKQAKTAKDKEKLELKKAELKNKREEKKSTVKNKKQEEKAVTKKEKPNKKDKK